MTWHRYGLEIGPIDLFGLTINPTLHWYGLIIVLGILAAASLAAWMARRDGENSEHVWNGLIWLVIAAVICARLWHVFFPSVSSVEAGRDAHWFLTHPFDLNDGPFIIWSGGLSVFGAMIGGIIGVLLYTQRHRLNRLYWLDLGAVVLPLGQAVGRWGNYANQELYGKPTDLPWAIEISNPPFKYAQYDHFHPLFLYESLWNFALCGVLLTLWLRRRDRLKPGDFFWLYILGYSVVRFLLEFLRIEVTKAGGINVSQVFTGIAAVIALGVLLYHHHRALRQRLSRKPVRGPGGRKRSKTA